MTSRAGIVRSLLPRLALILCASAFSRGAAAPPAVRAASAADTGACVIHVSVDGLRGDVVAALGPRALPNFYRLRIEGAFTDNARNDVDYTITLPNHACELTSRPVLGPDGHGVSFNSDDGRTLEQVHGSYVAGVFDVAHDRGLSTGMYASKSKFEIFNRSWNETNGAPDTTGADDGRDKIDAYVYQSSTAALLDSFVARMTAAPHRYAFIHLADPDGAGHTYGWESASYIDAVEKVDGLVGRILGLIDGDARFTNRTYLVVTADHGGTGTDHADAANPLNYTVPLYVWGPGVPAGADLYWLNAAARANPGTAKPPYSASPPPIRNSETGNISLDLLGLPGVPGSVIDAALDCDATLPGGADALPAVSITSPAPGTSLEYPAGIVVEATADPRGGVIACVDFYADGVSLGYDSTSPFSFAWTEIPLGDYRITARAVREDGIAATASVDFEMVSVTGGGEGPSPMRMPRVYPNPFGRSATIQFSLPAGDAVGIDVYDLRGSRVERLFGGRLGAGAHEITFDASGYAPGVYFLRLRAGGVVRTGKLMIVR
jgi:hypothetical protein